MSLAELAWVLMIDGSVIKTCGHRVTAIRRSTDVAVDLFATQPEVIP